MAEPEVGRAEFNRIHDTEAFRSGPDDPRVPRLATNWSDHAPLRKRLSPARCNTAMDEARAQTLYAPNFV
jgi:hypothetical protein